MAAMRIVVDIRREQEKILERNAADNHRTTREQAAFLLHQKLKELEADQAPVAQAS